jgi:hypothetical protein
MADETDRTVQTVVHVTPPTGGASIVHGITTQSDISAAVNVSKVDWRHGIQGRIRTTTVKLKKARTELDAATAARDRIARIIPIPQDLAADLAPVASAIRKFDAGTRVQEAPEFNGVTPDYPTKTISARLAVLSAHTTSIFTGSRSWPMPTGLVAAHDTVLAIQARITQHNSDLGLLRDELSKVDERAEEMHAAVIKHGLNQDAAGKAVLKAMDDVTRHALDELDARLGTDAANDEDD